MSIKLGGCEITRTGNDVYIIAEIGQNHQGNIDVAKQMILHAKAAGANCVKFQKSCLTSKFTKSALNRPYNSINSWGETYGDHKRFLEFNLDEYKDLQRFAGEIGVDFTASAMDEISLDQLDTLDVPFIKIGSGDTNNFPLLQKAAKLKRPLIISTGMQKMDTIERVVEIMNTTKKDNFALLHCVSSYPTDPKDCMIQMIRLLKQKYPNVVIGYSGHELGIDISVSAVLLGARILERHFTMDKSLKGSDHNCSLIPTELKQLTQKINQLKNDGILSISQKLSSHEIVLLAGGGKNLEVALVNVTEKNILPCEESCKAKLGKSLVAARNLLKGHSLEKSDLSVKVSEPNGIPAEQFDNVLGAILNSDVTEDCPIQYVHIN